MVLVNGNKNPAGPFLRASKLERVNLNYCKIRLTRSGRFVNREGGGNLGFSQNLTNLQAERSETNYRLAKSLKVHQTTIKNWKNGTTPHPLYLEKLAEHYGVTVDELLSGSEESGGST